MKQSGCIHLHPHANMGAILLIILLKCKAILLIIWKVNNNFINNMKSVFIFSEVFSFRWTMFSFRWTMFSLRIIVKGVFTFIKVVFTLWRCPVFSLLYRRCFHFVTSKWKVFYSCGLRWKVFSSLPPTTRSQHYFHLPPHLTTPVTTLLSVHFSVILTNMVKIVKI